jgi:hypothetical protein
LFSAPFFRERYSYVSYGILYDERYKKQKHPKQKPQRNLLDGKQYAVNQIHWLILKGDSIPENEPTRYKCSRLVDPNERWTDVVVTSSLDPRHLPLPTFLAEGNTEVQRACEISSNLGPRSPSSSKGDVTGKRSGIFGTGKTKFLRVNYEFLIFVERGQGLRFQTVVDEMNCNVENNTLEVQWDVGENEEEDEDEGGDDDMGSGG